MFQIIALIAIVGMFALMGMTRMGAGSGAAKSVKPIFLGRLAICATMLGALALAVSGFGWPLLAKSAELGQKLMLSDGTRMNGLLLLVHVACGGLFIGGLTGIALFCSEVNRLGGEASVGKGRKVYFWMVLGLGLFTTLTVLVSMTPVLSSHGIDLLYQAHRWGALVLVMALIGFGMSR